MQNEMKRIVILPYKQIAMGVVGLIALLLFLISFRYLNSIYIPILVSYFFAFLLNPVVSFLDKRGLGRTGPSMLLLFIFFAVILILVILMLPRLIAQVHELIEHLPQIINSLSSIMAPYSQQYFGFDIFADWQKFVQEMLPQIGEFHPTTLVGNLFSGTLRALSALASVLIVPILTFYMLKDYPYLNSIFLNLVPRRHVSAVTEVSRRLSIVLGNLIRGQFLVCLLLATFYAVGLAAVGLKMSMVLGLVGGMLNLIPFVGTLTAITISIIIALIAGGGITQCAGIVGVFLVGNIVESTVLTPRIVGKQMGISPLTIILVILAGGELLGVLGMLLALPVTAGVKVLGGYFLERYFASNYYKDQLQKD